MVLIKLLKVSMQLNVKITHACLSWSVSVLLRVTPGNRTELCGYARVSTARCFQNSAVQQLCSAVPEYEGNISEDLYSRILKSLAALNFASLPELPVVSRQHKLRKFHFPPPNRLCNYSTSHNRLFNHAMLRRAAGCSDLRETQP